MATNNYINSIQNFVPMEKEQIISEIKERIREEYKKYHKSNISDWAEIAAIKIYSICYENICTVDEYCKIMCEKRRTVYDKLKNK